MDRRKVKGIGSVLGSLALVSALVLSGCGGGGGGGSTSSSGGGSSTGTGSALQLAEKISVVDAKSTGSPVAPLRIGKFQLAPPSATSTSDWNKDVTQVFVHERSEEAFSTINEILCMIGQSQADEMVNKGDYKAMIDKNQCSTKRDDAGSAGKDSGNQTSGSTAPDYETWTVNSYRADSSSSQIVKVWVHEKERQEGGGYTEPAKVIEAKAEITEGVSSTNPYGLFTMNFVAYPVLNGVKSSTAIFKGILKSEKDANGKVLLKFVMDGGSTNPIMSMSEKSVLDRAADGSTGSGSAYHSFSSPMGSDTGSFNIAFNTANFLRQDTTGGTSGTKTCLDRTSFDETAWRYGLYDANGTRVTRNSGFPIKYNDGTKEYFGWAGYWGLWLPDSVTIADGATVKKQVFSATGSTETDYKLIRKGGKLKKHTQKMLTLADVKNIPLDYNEWTPPSGPSVNYRVIWNGSAFNKVAQQGDQTTNWMWADITPVPLDLTNLQWGELNFWSQSLGGQVRVKLDSCSFNTGTGKTTCSASNTTSVVFYAEDIVYPGDTVPSAFRCYDNCPTYDATNGVASSGWGTDPNNPVAYNYTFDPTASGMILKDGSNNNLIMTQASGTYQWGFMSGPLFEPTTANTDSLKCNWFTGDTSICGWKAWSALPVFYTWETGTQQWNQFTALQGPSPATTIVKFDPPLQVTYTHSQSNSAKPDFKYNGVKFYMDYSGFGELHGIPGVCVDMDSGQPVSCGPNTRWVPEFMIPEGGTASDGTTTYYIKPLEKEQRMSKVAESSCSALTMTSYTLPDISLWADPALGTEPTITGAPAVVGGVVQ